MVETSRGADTRAKLLAATTFVVREHGYAGATTRLISEAAGVAEGTIYRHFPDKRQLFFAAILERHQDIVAWMSGLPDRVGEASIRATLIDALTRLAELRGDLLPLELAVMADPELSRDRPAMGDESAPPRSLAAYLSGEQRIGRIRADVDPQLAAMVLLATLFGIAIAPSADGESNAAMIGAAISILLSGMEVRG